MDNKPPLTTAQSTQTIQAAQANLQPASTSGPFMAAAAYQPGRFIFRQKKGTLTVSGQTVTMLDEQKQPLFSLNMTEIKKVVLDPGSGYIVIKRHHPKGKYKVLFVDSKKQVMAFGEAEAGGGFLPNNLGTGVAMNSSPMQQAKRDINNAKPILAELKTIFERNGVKVSSGLF
jgi:hypothetical protein